MFGDTATTTTKFCILCKKLAFECHGNHDRSYLDNPNPNSGKLLVYIDITINLDQYLKILESSIISKKIEFMRDQDNNDLFINFINELKFYVKSYPEITRSNNSHYLTDHHEISELILSYMENHDLSDIEARNFCFFVKTLKNKDIRNIWNYITKCKNKNNVVLIHKYLNDRLITLIGLTPDKDNQIIKLDLINNDAIIKKSDNSIINQKNASNINTTLIAFLICCSLIYLFSLYTKIF